MDELWKHTVAYVSAYSRVWNRVIIWHNNCIRNCVVKIPQCLECQRFDAIKWYESCLIKQVLCHKWVNVTRNGKANGNKVVNGIANHSHLPLRKRQPSNNHSHSAIDNHSHDAVDSHSGLMQDARLS